MQSCISAVGIGQAHLQNTVGGSKAGSFLNPLPCKFVNIWGGKKHLSFSIFIGMSPLKRYEWCCNGCIVCTKLQDVHSCVPHILFWWAFNPDCM
jgi:hypothetical protein